MGSEEKTERLAYSIKEFQRLTGYSKVKTLAAIRRGELRTFKDGRRRMISAQAARDFIALRERLTAEAEGRQ
jgi:hypothetical protein